MTSSLEQHVVDLLGQTEALLRRLEWAGLAGPEEDENVCPDCRVSAPGPHAASCELARMIGAPAAPDRTAEAA